MLRNVNITSAEVIQEFVDDVSEFLDNWHKEMEELKRVGETERTKAHRTIKLIERFYFIHGV